MKNSIRYLFSIVLMALAWFPLALMAATPVGPMNYQGRLLDDQGIPVTGSYNFKVRIYNDPVAGVLKYSEDHNSIAVDDGVYTFKVGMGTNKGGDSGWDIDLWQGNLNDLFMELQVGAETLSPRHELTSAPHAFTATLALSLGNRTAEEFDNILEGICVSNKGKWLNTVMRCGGNGSDLSGSLWSNLDPSTDYSDLEFIDTDFSLANFSGINFSNTLLKQANIDNANFSNANFSGATLDGATFTTAPNFSSANFTNARIMNMNLAGVSLASATLTNFSAAKLSGCPSSLPAGWQCVLQYTGLYALVGADGNYSNTSAALISRYGSDSYLDLDATGTITNMSDSDFTGAYVDMDFLNAMNMTSTVFDYSQISRSIFQTNNLQDASFYGALIGWPTYNQCDMDGTNFDYAVISNATFEWTGMQNVSFYAARIDSTTFSQLNYGSNFYDGVASGTSFQFAKMRNVLFDYSNLGGMDFQNAFLTDVTFYGYVLQDAGYTYIDMRNARLDDVYFVSGYDTLDLDARYIHLSDVDFQYEDLTGSWFDDAYIYRSSFDNATLVNVVFDGATIEYSSFDGADLTGASFVGATFTSVTWVGTTCPDGTPAGGDNSCSGQF